MLDDLKERMHKTPFEPFRIVLTSGDRIEVTNPDNLALGESRISYFYPKTDKWVLIRTNQITMLKSANHVT